MKEQEAQKKHEVEIRALLHPNQKQSLIEHLEAKGAVLAETEHLMDEYFCPAHVQRFEEVEMDEIGSYSLRLRKKVRDGEESIEINTKMITKRGDHNNWEEHEMEISSFEEAEEILFIIGFKSFFTLRKKRFTYDVGHMSINLEDIDEFGSIIEAEIMTLPNKSEEAKKTIETFLQEIGITDQQIVPKSVTNILMREKARF